MKRLTPKNFIERSISIHGDKYIYEDIKYVNNHTKINIFCRVHGVFEQVPKAHLLGQGCPICKGTDTKTLTKNVFMDKSNIVHNNKYLYTISNYISNHTKIDILCKNHGEFSQKPYDHLLGKGCPKCGGT
jgi:Zn finger protein HypA/HybF involved in hydrogenase expression